MIINGGGSSITNRRIYATPEAAIGFFKRGGIADAIRDSYYVLSVMQLMFLMLIPNN